MVIGVSLSVSPEGRQMAAFVAQDTPQSVASFLAGCLMIRALGPWYLDVDIDFVYQW